MVRHQTEPEHIHGKPNTGVDDGLDEGVLVAGLMEYGLAAVEHVIPHARQQRLSQFLACHDCKYKVPSSDAQ
jgi:hypothetical protein